MDISMNFEDTEASVRLYSSYRCSQKFRNIHRKNPVLAYNFIKKSRAYFRKAGHAWGMNK